MLDSIKSLFFNGCDQLPVLHKGCGGITMVCVYSKNVHVFSTSATQEPNDEDSSVA
jgi:hypothetical protein